MPNPFPGMNPYLEDPDRWRGVHNRLITFSAQLIQEALPPGFIADIEERMYVVRPERSLYPDVMVSRFPPDPLMPRHGGGGGTTVLETELEPHEIPGILTVYPVEMREGFVEIRTGAGWKQVVTVIEILSPSNKASGSEGMQEYLRKQKEVLQSETHLLEIDLLRRGRHVVSAPRKQLLQRGKWDYLICLHRSTEPYQYEFWMNGMRQRLPHLRVPLTEGYPDVLLDLQAVLNRAYEAGPYDQSIDYAQAPTPPLSASDSAWADTLLREKGLR